MTPEVVGALVLKLIGATAGAVLALVFVPPRTRRGFVRRLSAALIFGVVFAAPVRMWAGFSDDAEGMIAAACLTGFVSWWIMGSAVRLARAWQGNSPRATQDD